jgi:uncharacterized membrane protein
MPPGTFSGRPAAELLDAAWLLTRRHFFTLLRLGWLPLLAAAILGVWSRATLSTPVDRWLVFGVIMPLGGLTKAAMIAGAWDLAHGRTPDSAEVWARVRRRAIAIMAGRALSALLITMGLVLFLLPGLYLLPLYFAVPAASVLENKGLAGAFARSRALARPAMERIFLPLVVIDAGALLLGVIILLSFNDGGWQHPTVLGGVMRGVAGCVVAPLHASLTALLYLDARNREEGYDLEQSIASLPGAG